MLLCCYGEILQLIYDICLVRKAAGSQEIWGPTTSRFRRLATLGSSLATTFCGGHQVGPGPARLQWVWKSWLEGIGGQRVPGTSRPDLTGYDWSTRVEDMVEKEVKENAEVLLMLQKLTSWGKGRINPHYLRRVWDTSNRWLALEFLNHQQYQLLRSAIPLNPTQALTQSHLSHPFPSHCYLSLGDCCTMIFCASNVRHNRPHTCHTQLPHQT